MAERKEPYVIEEEPGINFYCGCGRSQDLPYCDGSHGGTGLSPHRVNVTERRKIAICGCGRSGNLPYCDGTHNTL